MGVLARFRVGKTRPGRFVDGGGHVVEHVQTGSIVARCPLPQDAERIVRPLNRLEGAVDLLRESLGGPSDGRPADIAWHVGWVERVRAYLADHPRGQ